MSDTSLHALPRIAQNHIISAWGVREFPFDDSAKATKLEQHIGSMLAVNMYCLGICRDTKFRNEQCKLCIDCFFSVSMLAHFMPG
jgi:hypothetical protein